MKRANLFVVRLAGIHALDRRLNPGVGEAIGAGGRYQSREKAALIANENDLLSFRQELRQRFLERLGRHIVAGIQDDQVLDASGDAPISVFVCVTLIAGVKPTVLENFRGFLGMLPVSGKNIRTTD